MQPDASFAEQFGLMIGAISTLIAAIGGVAIVRGRKETKEGEGPSQLAVLKKSIDDNTASMDRQCKAIEEGLRRIEGASASIGNIDRNARDILGVARTVEHQLIALSARRQ